MEIGPLIVSFQKIMIYSRGLILILMILTDVLPLDHKNRKPKEEK